MYVTDPAFRLPGSPRPPAAAVSTCPSPVLRSSTWPNRPHTPSPRPSSPGATGRSAGLTFAGPGALLRSSMCSWRPKRRRTWLTFAIRRRCAAGASGRTGSHLGTAAEPSRSPRRSGTAGTWGSGGGRASGAIGKASSSLRPARDEACTSASRRRFQLKLRPSTRPPPRSGCRWGCDATVRRSRMNPHLIDVIDVTGTYDPAPAVSFPLIANSQARALRRFSKAVLSCPSSAC